MQRSAPTRIVRLEASNIKRLKAVQITPDGSAVVISGRNGQGKTSILDAIEMALGGKRSIPPRPVRDGEERARVVLELDDLVVTRTFTAAGGTSLRVESLDGASYRSPQAMLDKLVGELSFDPLAFSRMDTRAQVETLRRLVGVDLDALDTERTRLYNERTEVNRQIRRIEGQIASLPWHEDAPAEPVSVAAIAEELAKARGLHNRLSELQSRGRIERRGIEAAVANKRGYLAEIERLQKLIAREDERIVGHEANLKILSSDIESAQRAAPNIAEIHQRLSQVEAINKRVDDNERRAIATHQLGEWRERSSLLTTAIDDVDARKRDAIASASLPVEGLSFDADGVTLHGIPFEQASSAEQLRVSVAMGFAINPRLRVLLIRDGSLLDADSLRMVAEMAEREGGQVWIERVSDGGGVGVVIEDGEVVTVREAHNAA